MNPRRTHPSGLSAFSPPPCVFSLPFDSPYYYRRRERCSAYTPFRFSAFCSDPCVRVCVSGPGSHSRAPFGKADESPLPLGVR